MLLSNGEDQTQLLPSETETQVSNSDSVEGLLPVSKVYTDVAVVPEQQNNEIQHLISNLQREVEELRLKQRVVDGKRRQALSKILDIKGFDRIFRKRREEIMNLYQLNQREFELSLVGQGKSLRLIRFFIKIQLKKVFLLKWSQL
ncbi:Kinesin-like protein KIN-14U, variant 3 [Lathyrus oleraceus]|uniref:Kinesin-like protein KIN-14U, variant 3 n=1 Tax=Pisum sativum TaxID=3888 RepID=A0A9D5GYM5_PEA|nr:Kinesin-like protein KIN-14U, variant 3 [Pisum sativum]